MLPIPTDKDGGVCIISESEHLSLLNEKLQPDTYFEINSLNVQMGPIISRAKKVAKSFAKYFAEDGDEALQMGKYLANEIQFSDWKRFFSVVMTNVKTHKDPGQVSLRILHSSVEHPFSALEHAINKTLSRELANLRHLHFSTNTVVQQLKALTIDDDDIFIRADIKDFYLRGNPSKLSKLASADLTNPGSRKHTVMHEALEHILLTQFVQIKSKSDTRVFQVIQGSGMGRIASGAIADKAFWLLCEKDWAARLDVQERHGVKLYIRYRDDILIIAKRDRTKYPGLHLDYVRRIINLASEIYEVYIDEVSSSHTHFLDISITKSVPKLTFGVHFKATAQNVPLSSWSCHPQSIHESWPLAEFGRFARISSSHTNFLQAKKKFMGRLRFWFANHDILHSLERHDPYLQRAKMTQRTSNVSYLVLPFHMVTTRCRAIGHIEAIWNRWSCCDYLKHRLTGIRISWTNGSINVLQAVRMHIKSR